MSENKNGYYHESEQEIGGVGLFIPFSYRHFKGIAMVFITNDILLDISGILIALLAVLFVFCKRSFQYWEHRNIPYLKPSIPWGNLQAPHRRVVPISEDVQNLYNIGKAKGWRHMGIYSMTSPIYMPLDLELIKNIMAKDFHHFVDRGSYVNERDEPISAHLFAIGGKKWRNLRTKFTPTFTTGKMRQMFETIANCGKILEKYIEHGVDHTEALDIKSVLACYATDIIGSCAFGLECNTFKEPDTPFRQFGKQIFNFSSFTNLKLTFAMGFPNLAKVLGICILTKDVKDFFTKVVEDTVAYRQEKHVTRPDFLQMLIDIKNEKDDNKSGDGTTLTMNEIVAQCFVFFVAGFETSSTAMTFALGKHNDQITYDALSELKYLGQVIDETLRMYPPVPIVTRRCVEDYRLPDSDIIIEKNTKVFLSITGIHYDPEYYDNPEIFNPDRFSVESKHERHTYAHIPFGKGPRICIGMRFGIIQTKLGLASILKNFRVKLSSKTKVPLKMSPRTLFPNTEGGMWLCLEKI
ncbi:hypothetical protein JTB14_009881 [Gonioctena quinquepunctata]|nr:hypothetical protein JTB14_009881 [Gonioctena quinquepunctata]